MRSIVIQVASPAGPPPFGAPVEASVPFAKGIFKNADKLAIFAPGGKIVTAQLQPTMRWPDGSIRWLHVIFEAEAGPGQYRLAAGKIKAPAPLLREEAKQITVDTGKLQLAVPKSGKALFRQFCAAGKETASPLVQNPDLLLTRKDGKVFRATLAGRTRKLIIEETGPVRASLRIEGKCRAEDGEGLFDFILRLQAYRGRPEIILTLTWINTTDKAAEKLRDIRLVLPYRFSPNRLVFGCQTGVYDGPWMKGWPVNILQEDHNRYTAKTLVPAPDGRWINLSSGGCNGEHFPGWLYLRRDPEQAGLAIRLANFWQEYPNELTVTDREISVGLWPEAAARHLLSKPLLPSNPEGKPYTKVEYWPIMPHPYLAFFDGKSKCLDVPKGTAKTQQLLLSVSPAGADSPAFERKYWADTLRPVRGFVDPRQVAESRACGLFWPREEKHLPQVERTQQEVFGWYDRHIELRKCYGKFDYGDYHYIAPAPDYICHADPCKWGNMKEMPREGYWCNNEGDPLRELLLYYLRTGNRRAWELVEIVARHLLDVDLCHHPVWGLHTHSYGHCYLLTNATTCAPDHAWLLGAMEWAGLSGDPLVWEWLKKCGDAMAALDKKFVQIDTRNTGMHLHMMCQFYEYTGEDKYLEAAHPSAEALLATQLEDGTWPAYLWNNDPEIFGFLDHALAGLADYFAVTRDDRARAAIDKTLRRGDDIVPLYMYALARLAEIVPTRFYQALAKRGLRQYDKEQNRGCDPLGRGDNKFWAEWGVNRPEMAKEGRPPQFLKQTRTPSPIFSYALGGAWVVARAKKLNPTEAEATPSKEEKQPPCPENRY
jgi:hypothetical protein